MPNSDANSDPEMGSNLDGWTRAQLLSYARTQEAIVSRVHKELKQALDENASLRNRVHVTSECVELLKLSGMLRKEAYATMSEVLDELHQKYASDICEMVQVMKRVRFLHTRSGVDEFKAAYAEFDKVLNQHGIETPAPKERPY